MHETINKPRKFILIRKINKVAIVLFILGVGLGFLITAQWRTKTLRVSNPVTPYVSLTDTRDKLTAEQNNLKKQISDLQDQIQNDQEQLKGQSQSKVKVEELEKYNEQVGLTEIKGEGAVITLDDSKSVLGTLDSITHAADLRDIVNLLWGLDAKAISINGERIVYNTSIDCIVNTILINSTKTTTPFTISVIGDKNKIIPALLNEENLSDLHKRVKTEGVIFEVIEGRNIIMPAFDGSFPIKFAKIR